MQSGVGQILSMVTLDFLASPVYGKLGKLMILVFVRYGMGKKKPNTFLFICVILSQLYSWILCLFLRILHFFNTVHKPPRHRCQLVYFITFQTSSSSNILSTYIHVFWSRVILHFLINLSTNHLIVVVVVNSFTYNVTFTFFDHV